MLSASHLPSLDVMRRPDSRFGEFGGTQAGPSTPVCSAATEAWLFKAHLEDCSSPGGRTGERVSPLFSSTDENPHTLGTTSPVSPPTDLNTSETSTSPDNSSPSLLKPVEKKRKRQNGRDHSGDNRDRPRRNRINYTRQQLQAMEALFAQTQYPDVVLMEDLALRLSIPVEKLATWFQNRRSKFRKESKNGHISWMRAQLYTNHSAHTQSSEGHVLSPPNVNVNPDSSLSSYRLSSNRFPYYSHHNSSMFLDMMGTAIPASHKPSRQRHDLSHQQHLPFHHSAHAYDWTSPACSIPLNTPVMSPATEEYPSNHSDQQNYIADVMNNAVSTSSYTAPTSGTHYYSQCYFQASPASISTHSNSQFAHY